MESGGMLKVKLTRGENVDLWIAIAAAICTMTSGMVVTLTTDNAWLTGIAGAAVVGAGLTIVLSVVIRMFWDRESRELLRSIKKDQETIMAQQKTIIEHQETIIRQNNEIIRLLRTYLPAIAKAVGGKVPSPDTGGDGASGGNNDKPDAGG